MKSKHLLFNGCSFTDENYNSHELPVPVKPWPYWVCKELNYTYENLALSGSGNDRIGVTTCERIYKSFPKVDGVGIGLSGWDRFYYFDKNKRMSLGVMFLYPMALSYLRGDMDRESLEELKIKQPQTYFTIISLISSLANLTDIDEVTEFRMDEKSKEDAINYMETNLDYTCMRLGINPNIRVRGTFEKNLIRKQVSTLFLETLNHVCSIVDICRANNIPLAMAQATGTGLVKEGITDTYFDIAKKIERHSWTHELLDLIFSKKLIKEVINSPQFDYLEKIDSEDNNIRLIGWPWISELGGRNIDSLLSSRKDRYKDFHDYKKKCKVSMYDLHWSEEGHKAIAELIYLPHLKEML